MSAAQQNQVTLPQQPQLPGRVPQSIWARVGTGLHKQPGHPLCILREEVEQYFEKREPGKFKFNNDLNPVVTVKDCFDDLLVPPDHPSRAPSDTYYIDDNYLLRAHMTAHDVKLLQSGLTSFVNCGDVYRRDTVDRTHYPVFHQVDAVKLFEPGVSSAEVVEDLQDALAGLARHLFGPKSDIRWVSAYFPFTDPSFELEVQWDGEWLELLGCGQLQRNVLRNGNVSDDVNAWAFGIGLERLAMVLFQIPDIRLFWTKDPRFHEQFENGGLDVRYKPFSLFPSINKDISFWLNDPTGFHPNDLHEQARILGKDLVESVQLVDTFEKNGRKSLCFRFTFRSMERSLTHIEINDIYYKLRNRISECFPIELR